MLTVNSNTIELTVHNSCYCVLDLLCDTIIGKEASHEDVYEKANPFK